MKNAVVIFQMVYFRLPCQRPKVIFLLAHHGENLVRFLEVESTKWDLPLVCGFKEILTFTGFQTASLTVSMLLFRCTYQFMALAAPTPAKVTPTLVLHIYLFPKISMWVFVLWSLFSDMFKKGHWFSVCITFFLLQDGHDYFKTFTFQRWCSFPLYFLVRQFGVIFLGTCPRRALVQVLLQAPVFGVSAGKLPLSTNVF